MPLTTVLVLINRSWKAYLLFSQQNRQFYIVIVSIQILEWLILKSG